MTLTGNALKAGVMGDPISHSLSPRLHGFWLKKYNIDGAYLPFHVTAENLESALKSLPKLGIKGVNLTVPHKELALNILDEIDDKARRIGAVNTVIVTEDGRLRGTNSDGDGFYGHLIQSTGFKALGKQAVLIGAGGAARAILVSLLDAGIEKITLINRTKSRAEVLKNDLNESRIIIGDWNERAALLTQADLLINSTVLGMTGQRELELDLSELPTTAITYDIVYNPLETNLLKNAGAKGCICVDGIGMLLHQAVIGFEAWFGFKPEVDEELRNFVLEGLSH